MSIAERTPLHAGGMRTDRIAALVWSKGLTRADLADALGVGGPSLSQKMHGKRRWYLEEVMALASALGTTVAYLTGETDDPSTDLAAVDAVEWAEFQLWRARRDSNSQPSDP